jgi:hypothetical protein
LSEETPLHLLLLAVMNVVLGAELGVRKDFVGLEDERESLGVSGLLIVGMKALREQSIHARDGIGMGARTDLEHLVEIDEAFL